MSEEAAQLLFNAIKALNNRTSKSIYAEFIQNNNLGFVCPHDQRTKAIYFDVLNKLIQLGLVNKAGYKGKLLI